MAILLNSAKEREGNGVGDSAGAIPKNLGIAVDWESILYSQEPILFHGSAAKNGKKESILDSQESESTQFWRKEEKEGREESETICSLSVLFSRLSPSP